MIEHTILEVIFRDHHWFDDHHTESEITDDLDFGKDHVLVHEIGYLLKETPEYLILGSTGELNQVNKEVVWHNGCKILKSDVISRKVLRPRRRS